MNDPKKKAVNNGKLEIQGIEIKLEQSMAMFRLKEEYTAWRLNHPLGFYARPELIECMPLPQSAQFPYPPVRIDGKERYINLFKWNCGIPGKSNVSDRHHFNRTHAFTNQS